MSLRFAFACTAGAVLLASSFAVSAVDRHGLGGAELFNFHSCVNCHGTEGKNPVSRLVPKIGGMDAAEIQDKALKILRGETDSEEAKLMKSAVAYSQACDAPPTTAEIEKIAEWLATLK